LSTTESQQQQQQQQQQGGETRPSADDGDVVASSCKAGRCSHLHRHSTPLRRPRNAAATPDNRQHADQHDDMANTQRRSTEGDSDADERRSCAGCGRVKSETAWRRVAEILDRFFFFLFLVLLVLPTVTILLIVRLFKPEL